MSWRQLLKTFALVVSPVTSLMKDQVESFGSEVSKEIKYNEGPPVGAS